MKTKLEFQNKLIEYQNNGIIEDVICDGDEVKFTYSTPFYDLRDIMYIKNNIEELQNLLFSNYLNVMSMTTSFKDFKINIKILFNT
jgi:hypothetical protein